MRKFLVRRMRAQSMVELVLLLPIFFLLLIAVVDASWVLLKQYELDLAAADLARGGSQLSQAAGNTWIADRLETRFPGETIGWGWQTTTEPGLYPAVPWCWDWRQCYFSVYLSRPVQLLLPIDEVVGVQIPWPGGTSATGALTVSASSSFRVGAHRAWR